MIRLICIPYAGATAMNYLRWKKLFDKDIQLVPVDPPARGKRISESPSATIEEAVDDITQQILKIIEQSDEPYALYGHSMGCLLIYELLHLLNEDNIRLPEHVFLSGRNPPQYPISLFVSHLEDKKFIQEILKYGGTPEGFFDNEELSKLFLPILRADYKMVENYEYIERLTKLPINITFFYSRHDAGVSIDWVNRWKELITGKFKIHSFDGGHFFIYDESQKIADIINSQLMQIEV